ncbi:hypothetical protein scyTo_0024115, partial [Scyliorhinus torazame]|nr:hypothetical protein [Scyliorhinus torazame]
MAAYHRDRQQQEKLCNLEQRRKKLQLLLQEEQDLLEEELRELKMDAGSLIQDAKEKTEELKSAREERRRKKTMIHAKGSHDREESLVELQAQEGVHFCNSIHV